MRFFLIVMLSSCCSAQIASLKLRNIERYNDSYPVTGNCLLGDVGSSAWTSDGSVTHSTMIRVASLWVRAAF